MAVLKPCVGCQEMKPILLTDAGGFEWCAKCAKQVLAVHLVGKHPAKVMSGVPERLETVRTLRARGNG